MKVQMFHQELIDLSIDVDDELQLFDLVGDRVMNLNFAKLGYISSLEKRELSYPTGLKFPSISVAFPHVDSLYIENPFIYIARTTKKLAIKQMGDSAEMETNNFLFLGIKDASQQPELLAQMIAAFQDENFSSDFMNVNKNIDMYNLINEKFVGEKV